MRPDILNPLFAEVETLKGVGGTLAKPLGRLGITRLVDLLFHLPSGVIERKAVAAIEEDVVGAIVTVALTPRDYRGGRTVSSPLNIEAFDDQGGHVSLVYFGRQGGYAKKLLPLGVRRIVSGKLDRYGERLQIVHPEVVEGGASPPAREAVYPSTEGLTSRRLGQLVAQALARAPDLAEWIEPSLKAARGWPDWRGALVRIHAEPDDESARTRLAYDEVFASQLALMLVRASSRRRRGMPLIGDGRLRDALDLPYVPTAAQRRAIAEIDGDIAQATPMVRLLQGDVGSGKTLVAAMALLAAVEAGAQGALLAPTEILARQHFTTLRRLLSGLPVEIAILTGREKGRARESVLMGLADGSIDILVGTHAIFQQAVGYHNLGLAVVDEQHRFGVAQRLLLTDKAERPPHLLVMTATPIPRTLELANYGEMDVSRIEEMPPGRHPIETRVLSVERIDEVIDGLGRHIAAGGQAYWVCPLVEESETSDQAAAEARAAALRQRFGDRIGLVHGRMKGPEKDAVMTAFETGALAVLVATTVIEVGVDVANASLMVVEHAERFGLSQLHQLRGRVGRGSVASICVLLYSTPLSDAAKARLKALLETGDGFEISRRDLEIRGPGELLGARQSGAALLRFADPLTDEALLLEARRVAERLLDTAPEAAERHVARWLGGRAHYLNA
jgi:ATP-dependent DNA helicase RecG